MTMNPEGVIPETDLVALMVQLWRDRFTGALRLENESIIKIVYLKDGDLLSASTNDRDDSIGEILLRGEKLTREHLKQAMGKRKDDESIADTLLALGFISKKELVWVRRTQLVGVVRSILGWTAGNYAIVSDYLPRRQEGTSFHLPQILLEVFLTETNRETFDAAFDGGAAVLDRTAEFEAHYESLGLNEEADEICSLIDESRTVAEVAEQSSADSFNVLKLLYSLEKLGLLSREKAEARVVSEIFSQSSKPDGDGWSAADLDLPVSVGADSEAEGHGDAGSEPFMRPKRRSRVPVFLLIVLVLMLLGIGVFASREMFPWKIPTLAPESARRQVPPRATPGVSVKPIPAETATGPAGVRLEELPMLLPVVIPSPELVPTPVPRTELDPEVEGVPTPSPLSSAPAAVPATVTADPIRARYDQMAREFEARMGETAFSIQFAILCQTGSVTNAMKLDGSNIWFVPIRFRDQPCYRAFWGRYDERETAEKALLSLPDALRQGSAPTVVRTR